MAFHGEKGFLSDWDEDVCDASAIEQATVQVRSEVPLVREAFRGDRGFLDLTHQGIQRIGEWAVLKVSARPASSLGGFP